MSRDAHPEVTDQFLRGWGGFQKNLEQEKLKSRDPKSIGWSQMGPKSALQVHPEALKEARVGSRGARGDSRGSQNGPPGGPRKLPGEAQRSR